jgi:hypothetical protein
MATDPEEIVASVKDVEAAGYRAPLRLVHFSRLPTPAR